MSKNSLRFPESAIADGRMGTSTVCEPWPARQSSEHSSAAPSIPHRQAVAPAKRALHALGRLRDGEENATEKRYAAHLEQRKSAGEIRWYLFEGIKLKLAPKSFLTVDYAVMAADGQLEMHDVKGARAIFSDDAKVKMKVAADKFPFVFKVAFPKKQRDGGGWDVEEI
ncbi:hypothetical protein [Caballeronia sp. LZ032]|uniref:hypothetical protein n=1 Tax=Caballeronia sp. LZ032 TaxID=3038565 RepID=UPI00286395EB|nr:hypothetical protein [Caballeronia sp. LZ032]MDR5881098.1 hypothetical protein [Caballeronia sp. LZ032]